MQPALRGKRSRRISLRRMAWPAGLFLACVLCPAFSAAQGPAAGQAKRPALFHTPPKADELPYPGQPLKLTVRLTNTRMTDGKIRATLVKDGIMLDVPAKEGYLNEYDQPTFEIPTTAPVAEIAYHFTLFNADGSVANSPRYAVRRSCIPNVDLAPGKIPAEVQGVERLQALVNGARNLEQDLNSYEKVIDLLGQIKKLIE